MAEILKIAHGDKPTRYKMLLPQIKSVVEGEEDMIANMANITAMLHETFGWFWIGFYRVMENTLVLGPFQGTLACTRISYGRGVCGTSWKERKTIVVPNVDEFPGHIACSARSKSEIVVPLFNKANQVMAVLDIDSEQIGTFDETDRFYLERIVALLV